MHDHFDYFRFRATLRLLRPLTDAQVRAAFDGAPAAARDAAAGSAHPRARLALAVHHQADIHLVSDAVSLDELVG